MPTSSEHEQTRSIAERIRAALTEEAHRGIEVSVEVGALLAEGSTERDVAELLGLPRAEIEEAIHKLQLVAGRL